MRKFIFNLQRFAEVLVGKTKNDKLVVAKDRTQIYGLAGNDTLTSTGKSEVLLIGGTGDDVLSMTGGNGTLSGGKGADTFNLSYSDKQTISAVIEDIDPDNDEIFITYNGSGVAQLNQAVIGGDVILTDDDGYFNLTLKGSTDASDYYEGTANENIWDILRIVNKEREDRNLSPLTLAQGLMDGSSIRAKESEEYFSHTRPDGTSCFTALKKSYSYTGENLAAGNDTPQKTMNQWMNSEGHRANILTDGFKKLGVGYYYDSNSYYKYYWVQMFAGSLNDVETISTGKILETEMILEGASIANNTAKDAEPITNDKSDVTISGSADNDSITSEGDNVSINGGDGNDTITVKQTSTYNWDTRAWEDTYHDKATINGGKGEDVITNYNDNALIDGGAGFDRIFNHGDSATVQVESGNNLVVNGEFFAKGGTNIKIIGGKGNDTITNSGSNSILDGGAGNDFIYNGYYYYESWNTFYDDSYNKEHNDKAGSSNTTISGGAGNDFIKNRGDNILFRYSADDGNDLIEGFNSTSTLSIANSTYSTKKDFNDIIVTVGDNKITLKGAASLSAVNIVTDKNSADSTLLNVTDKNKSPVTVGAAVKTIDASERIKAVKITGNALDNSLIGGKGADTLNGGKGNDTLTGGGGDDIFIYSAGNDVISDYASGDKISLGAAITKAEVDGADVVFKFKNGSLTVKDAEGQSLSMIDSKGKSFSTVIGGGSSDSSDSDLMTVTNSSASVVTADSDVKTIDASKRTKAIKITGNALDNSITGSTGVDSILGGDGADTLRGGKGNDSLLGGAGNDSIHGGSGNDRIYGNAGADVLFGGAGKDSLWGGAGNDTLWGSNGTDTFIYQAGGGTDSIMDYASGELLRILTKDGKSKATFSKSAFDDDTLTLTVNGGGTVIFNNIDDATTFNINGTTYKVSGSKLAKNK